MDELELLKKDWQKKSDQLPKLSYDEIYRMILKKSSSIVKWIFYISIAEFLFWILIGQLPLEESKTDKNFLYTETLAWVLEGITYAVMLFFMVKFYLNYKQINNTDSAKALMQKILKTRKTVVNYVWASMSIAILSGIIISLEMFFYEPEFKSIQENIAARDNPILIYVLMAVLIVVCLILLGGALWLFYRLIYGILLKRLLINYKELKKLEV
ncbi:hypothetical protein [Flavobacterium sp. ASW18X]|uniref:hypothetical protein n=1 Tax=Flavobacterium sp. ASW18X TaxID=2572595 RepID=UPI0010AE2D2D|nr:hypothetical protein FBT53_15200 [Flavobacterium sp. ASW18X]